MCVCDTLTVYTITQKILDRSAPFCMNTLGTLDQHEFAFRFCGSIGSKDQYNEKSLGRDPCCMITLVFK